MNRVSGREVWDLGVRLHFCSGYSEGPDEAGSGSWVKGGNSLQQPFPRGRATINDADRKQEVDRKEQVPSLSLPKVPYRQNLTESNCQRKNVGQG